MPLNPLTREAAELVKNHLREACPGCVFEVKVFGSRARGDARPDSDLDILVLTSDEHHEEVDNAVCRAAQAASADLDYPFPISPHVMTRSHFQELLDRERLFAREVMEEGIPI